MKNDNNKIKFQSLIICCCLFLMGFVISTLVFILYPNEILCEYTKNELLCYKETKICNKGYWGNECIKCLNCKNGVMVLEQILVVVIVFAQKDGTEYYVTNVILVIMEIIAPNVIVVKIMEFVMVVILCLVMVNVYVN